MIASPSLFAQSSSGSTYVVYGLVVVGVLVVLAVIVQVADNLLQIEAKKRNIDGASVGIFPRIRATLGRSLPEHLAGEDVHVLKKGFDIKLEGEAAGDIADAAGVTRYAMQPPNWRGIAPIPKMHVAVGDNVTAGQPLFFDKQNPEIQFVAPVSGEVIEINRGAKRAIVEVVILADKEIQYKQFNAPDVDSASRDEIVEFLLESGAWTLFNQRPYDILAPKDSTPENIFISTFDTAPLAPDLNMVVDGRDADFQAGLDVLNRLTEGAVHLGLDGRDGKSPAAAYANATNVTKHYFRGPHPCGNVGVQIHHTAPINAGAHVWSLKVQDVMTLGALFTRGQYDTTRIVALTGEPLEQSGYVRTYMGANISELLKGNTVTGKVRMISGDVLSGQAKPPKGYLNAADDQLTVVTEGDDYEMFGWLLPSKARPSISKTYPTTAMSDLRFVADTNTHGEKRAFVVTGQYERVLPMDIYPQHLLKAIMAKDFERMEGLGIYELSEEDIALCEFACTSKMPLQQILREGLDLMREQG